MKRFELLFIPLLFAGASAGYVAHAHRVHRYTEAGNAALAAPAHRAKVAAKAPAKRGARAALAPARAVGEETEPAPLATIALPSSREEVRERIQLSESGTYIRELLLDHDSSLARWPQRDRPLRVWVQPASDVAGWRPEFVDRVRQAFVDWQQTGIPLRFEFAADSAAADVHVNFVDQFDEPISGKTLWARDAHWWIIDANIQLAVHHNRGESLDPSAMQAIALHEVGHVLGLDHTADTANIMTARVRVRELSAADKATARLLYTLPAGAVR